MTLPTRADGGIDWDKVYPDWDHTSRFITINLAKEAVARARERCAKWHDGQEKIALECGHREIATWHRLAAEKFRREMED